MTIYDAQIKEILSIYESLRDSFKFSLENAPEGKLIHQKNGNNNQFLLLTYENGKRVRRGINKNKQLIRELAKKEFDCKAYKILSNNIEAYQHAVKKQIAFDPKQIIASMTKAYSQLSEEYFYSLADIPISANSDNESHIRIKRHEEWWKQPYKEYWGHPEYKTRTTPRGQKVRSGSELLIAETLYRYSVPFHYEEELEIDGKVYAPDFTFEDYDKKPFYLEYFGMMNNTNYSKKNFLKLDDYYNIGLIPGDNLIVVFDSNGIMNMGMIDAIVRNEIIPRL